MLQRIMDVVVGAIALTMLSPLFVAAAVVVKASSPGPVFYRTERVGKDGRRFTLLKFRSMHVSNDGARLTRAGDTRVTAMGAVLRRWKIDELPQLLNVLRGDMSLVGPRPEDPVYVAHYTEAERDVLRVRPGLTGPASLLYRNEETQLTGDHWERTYIEQIMREKLRIDLEYLSRRSVASDLNLLIRTAIAIFRH